jgi:hypothetical protein
MAQWGSSGTAIAFGVNMHARSQKNVWHSRERTTSRLLAGTLQLFSNEKSMWQRAHFKTKLIVPSTTVIAFRRHSDRIGFLRKGRIDGERAVLSLQVSDNTLFAIPKAKAKIAWTTNVLDPDVRENNGKEHLRSDYSFG